LGLPLNYRWVIDILSRLVETVAESNDDMQGYVTEILLTVTYNIDSLAKQISGSHSTSIHSLSHVKDSINSHSINPNVLTNKIEAIQQASILPSDRRHIRTFRRQSRDRLSVVVTNSGMATAPTSPRTIQNNGMKDGHSTTTICPNNFLLQPDDLQQKVVLRFSPDSDRTCASTTSTLTRSHSEDNVQQNSPSQQQQQMHMLNSNTNTTNSIINDVQTLAASIDDAKTVLAQLFWIAICLLESDYEYEFTLAVQLLTTIIDRIQINTYDYIDRIMNILKTITWQRFPGVQSLILKGCTSSITFESTMILISSLTNILTLPFISTNKSALSMNIIALLPYMMYNYDNQQVVCTQAADRIAKACHEHVDSKDLANLEAVMSLYAQGKFGSTGCSQWAKCVLKYLADVYAQDSINWIRFLCEILDNGPNYLQNSILDIFYHLATIIDTKTLNDYTSFNNELVRTLSKYVNKTEYCQDVTKTLKFLIQRSSTLSTPKHITSTNNYTSPPITLIMDNVVFESHKSTIELPGRTLDIHYNLSEIMNLIKTKDQQNQSTLKSLPSSSTITNRRRHNYVAGTVANSDIEINIWKQNAIHSQVEFSFFLEIFLN